LRLVHEAQGRLEGQVDAVVEVAEEEAVREALRQVEERRVRRRAPEPQRALHLVQVGVALRRHPLVRGEVAVHEAERRGAEPQRNRDHALVREEAAHAHRLRGRLHVADLGEERARAEHDQVDVAQARRAHATPRVVLGASAHRVLNETEPVLGAIATECGVQWR
jgi:hypothetical protein